MGALLRNVRHREVEQRFLHTTTPAHEALTADDVDSSVLASWARALLAAASRAIARSSLACVAATCCSTPPSLPAKLEASALAASTSVARRCCSSANSFSVASSFLTALPRYLWLGA